jgi:hypothetical protein
MSFNSILLKKIIKLCRTELRAIVNLQHLNLPTNLIFQEGFKLLKPTKNFKFSSKKIYPCPSRIIINKALEIEVTLIGPNTSK